MSIARRNVCFLTFVFSMKLIKSVESTYSDILSVDPLQPGIIGLPTSVGLWILVRV